MSEEKNDFLSEGVTANDYVPYAQDPSGLPVEPVKPSYQSPIEKLEEKPAFQKQDESDEKASDISTLVFVDAEPDVKPEANDADEDSISEEELEAINKSDDTQPTLDDQFNTHPIVQKYKTENSHVLMERNIYLRPEEQRTDSGHITDLLDMPVEDAAQVLLDIADVRSSDSETEEAVEWLMTFQNGSMTQPEAGQFVGVQNRENSQWRQSVPSQAGNLQIRNIKNGKIQGSVSGAAAQLYFQSTARIGKPIRIPLWHSGFWVSMRTPTATRQAEMYDQLRSIRVKAGTETYGRVFNNYTVFANAVALDLAYECIFATSLDIDPSQVRALVDISDIPHLIWALAVTIWPNGFEYSRCKMGDPNNANNTVRQVIRPENCQWTDITLLTEWQRNHMAKSSAKAMKVEDLERYRKEFGNRFERRVVIREKTEDSDEISFLLSPPAADDYLESGQRWINDIIKTYNSIAGRPGGDKARDEYALRNMRLTEMRSFAHWVKEISHRDVKTSDQDGILKTLNVFSEDDDMRARFYDAVFKYIEDITVSIIAVTTDDYNEAPLPRYPYLIPIEPVHTFFTRLEQKFSALYAS